MPQEEKEDAISIANLFEELLFEYQDHTMFSSDVNDCIRFDENTTQQLFSTAVKSDLILKIQKRRINQQKSSTKRARYVIVCVPGDHFELHKIDVDTETQQLCIHDKHTQKLLDSSIRINDIDKRQMKKLISQLESSDNNRPSSKLSVESSQIIFNSAVCSLHSNRLQYERIQQNADESKSVSISNFIPQQNNYSDKFGSFAYIIRPTIKIGEIPPVKRKQHRIQIEDLPDEDQLPVVTRIDDQSKDSMQLLISEEGTSTSNEELEDVDEFDIEIDESFQLNDKQSSAMIYFEGSEEESEENESEETAKIDQKAVEGMLKLLQSDESSINVESLLAINQFFELSQPTIGYSKQSTDQFKLPQTTVFEMDEVERFISGRFDCKPSTAKSNRVYINSSTTNPLEILINEQYKTVLAELQHLQNNKIPAGLANNDNDELTYPVALKLQLNTKTPNFMQVLPTDSVKFNVKYVPKKRLLTLQYQTIVQQDCLTATCSDGSKLSFNVECKPSVESSSTTPTKSSASPSTTCLMLKKPAIRAEILKHFVKMSDSERSQWLLAIKHRFLRQKHFQQKRRIFRSIDKMHKVADEVLKENKEELSGDKNKTDAEIKKAAIQRLLARKDTKYPVDELKTKSKTKKSTSSTKQKSSLHLADLLLQSTSRCRMNLSKKMHPTFAKIDSTKMKEKWSDKTEAIKVQYKVGKKSLIAFDHSLENFYKKLNHELPSKLFEAKPIETSEDIHDRLLFFTNAGPSKIIKYKVPTEVPTSTRPEKKTEQQTPVAVAEQPPASLPDLNLDQFVSAETPPYADEQNASTQQTDSSRERQISSIQIPSAMQVPASAVYHLQSDPQATSASQTVQNADPVYYTKRSLNTFSPASSGTNVVQRIAPIQTQSFEPTRVSSISALNVPKQRQLAPRPMVRHVVIGNRPKMSGDTDSMERQFVQQREESGYESRYYQTAIGQRELTVREKLQQDMARGVVQSGQKKHYPVRVPTTMKRKISESQHQFGDESPNAIDPKRSRPAQYMYQVKGPSTILSSQAAKPQQTSMSGNISNLSEQQSTSQTVPMIFHHGEPIKTYIRRENHQFSIHDPASYHSTPSGSPAQYSKSPQLKVYEKRSTPSEPPSTVQRKSADTEPEASSSSV
ncbi:hypothetical protein M3Y97_00797800 [Aphelenchoides bicaudatus]|nr:hypothetical protein M3Y97_00797800 [Aphelenchoides bicaudatus]